MNIDVNKYLDLEIGHTDWIGESQYDDVSSLNLDKLNEYLSQIENMRDILISRLEEHICYRKGNASAEYLHKKAKKIRAKHIIKEFTHVDFEHYWESD